MIRWCVRYRSARILMVAGCLHLKIGKLIIPEVGDIGWAKESAKMLDRIYGCFRARGDGVCKYKINQS